MVLVISFAADMVYSHYVPNTGEGITDYKAWEQGETGETVLCLFFYSGRHRTVPCLPCIII